MLTNKKLRTVVMLGVSLIVVVAYGWGQAGQEKFAGLKDSAAQNKQRLMHYQWTETQQVTYKGEPKGTKQFLCRYSADGQVIKTPVELSDSQAPQERQGRRRGGALKERIVEKKKEETEEYMGDVKSILALYLPPNPQKMQEAFKAGKVSFSPGGDALNLVFKDYAQPGDQMTVAFNEKAKKINHIDVNTYTPTPDQVVTLAVQFASLADGTNYARQTVLDAKAKNLVVTTTNSNYVKLAN